MQSTPSIRSPARGIGRSSILSAALLCFWWLPLHAQSLPALETSLGFPVGVAMLSDGRVLISERRNHRVLRLDVEAGTLERIAGTGVAGYSGDGGPARNAQLSCPDAIDVDSRGNLYIADRCNERIRRVDAQTGRISTVAGTGQRGPGGDGPALSVDLTGVFYLRVDSDERILFTDTDANLVRELDVVRGTIHTLAGSGVQGFAGDGGPARSAELFRPHVVLRLESGDLVIGDSFNHRLRVVDVKTGVIRTIAGTGAEGPAMDGARAVESPLLFFGQIHELPGRGIVWSEWGSSQLLLLDGEGRLRVLAGSLRFGEAGPDGPSREAALGSIVGFVLDEEGRLVVAASSANLIRRIDLGRGSVETIAGKRGSS